MNIEIWPEQEREELIEIMGFVKNLKNASVLNEI
jgi:hypothetical protein